MLDEDFDIVELDSPAMEVLNQAMHDVLSKKESDFQTAKKKRIKEYRRNRSINNFNEFSKGFKKKQYSDSLDDFYSEGVNKC